MLRRLVSNQRGSIAIEFAIAAPLMALILFGCLDLFRLFQLNAALDSRAVYLADYFADQGGRVDGNFAPLVEQMRLSDELNYRMLSGAAEVIRMQAGSTHSLLARERSDAMLPNCSVGPNVPAYGDGNEATYIPSQTWVHIGLCLKVENGFFISPLVKQLSPVLVARATRGMTSLSIGRANE